ncbi:MAG: hypothetical protein K6U78_09385, partial [Anaerolineae bacterium]|nr:hypothetical protein [Anaerolineae bacterium]
PPHEPHVRTLVAHPSEPDTLYAGVEVGGVLRTRDGGETWEELNEGIYIDVHTLAVSRAVPERMYACTGTGFYRSTDGGQRWVRSMEGLARRYTVGLTVMPGDTDIVVAAAGTGPPGVNGEVFVSRDSGATWQPAGDGLPAPMTRVPALAAAECRLYAGLDTGALYRSEDAGRTWQRLGDVGAPILTITPVMA